MSARTRQSLCPASPIAEPAKPARRAGYPGTLQAEMIAQSCRIRGMKLSPSRRSFIVSAALVLVLAGLTACGGGGGGSSEPPRFRVLQPESPSRSPVIPSGDRRESPSFRAGP